MRATFSPVELHSHGSGGRVRSCDLSLIKGTLYQTELRASYVEISAYVAAVAFAVVECTQYPDPHSRGQSAQRGCTEPTWSDLYKGLLFTLSIRISRDCASNGSKVEFSATYA